MNLSLFTTNINRWLTPESALSLFGQPTRRLEGGLIIYEYDLDDGTEVRLGFPGYRPITYAVHIDEKRKGKKMYNLLEGEEAWVDYFVLFILAAMLMWIWMICFC